MHEITLDTSIPHDADAVWAWHNRPGAFERLSPPWHRVRVLQSGMGIAPGEGKTLEIALGPRSTRFQVRHTSVEPGRGFVDEQVTGPFAHWRHEHRFEPDGHAGCRIVDHIRFALPGGWLGERVAGARIHDDLEHMLRFRHMRIAHDLDRHGTLSIRPLRIAISGSTGLVGTQLSAFLTSGGHDVVRLVRGRSSATADVRWDPATGEIDAHALEGLDAVVHLAGENLSDGRWTTARKQAIRESRVKGTSLLAKTLARLERPPQVLVSVSGIGVYGDRGDERLTEAAELGDDFLSEVCRVWEASAEPARQAGIRVVHPRLGVVISAGGGMLARILPLFRAGLGGRLGDGDQWLSWIGIDDLLAMLLHMIVDTSLAGPVNAVSPHPVTNRDLTATLGRVLHRPTIIPAPAAALRLAFGGLADELLLASQRAEPARLTSSGFTFTFPSIEDAIQSELGRMPAGVMPAETHARSMTSGVEGVVSRP